jgi:putative ABC transport system ATP-binding protein
MFSSRNISFDYNKEVSFEFTDWNIEAGEKWLLIGNSGSGKSTLIHIISGLLAPKKGDILINGTNIYALPKAELDRFRALNVGMVFQKAHFIKSLSILENLKITQSLMNVPVNHERIYDLLESLNLADKAKCYPRELSQGQLQRISIARALMNKPGLLVADEPTSSLDDINTEAVLDLLIGLSEINKSALIIATHDKRVKSRITKTYLL